MDVLKIIGGAVVLIVLLFLAPLIGVLCGAFSGWIVGFWWTDPILNFLSRFGLDTAGLTLWQIGAALGFLGSFFKSTLTTTKE